MPISGLESAKSKTVGTKQTLKALNKGLAKKVFVASDADQHVIKPVLQLCQEKGVEVVTVDSMKALGKACHIDVGCAVCAITEE
ncbi:ribosomal protein L7Ae/L30e/S12e/Gadd45 [Thermincola ferriacetica]|uniref:Ribosomal protein L7Ae/L30e/S12e/Gadd45 n=2 Tax=Thermincola TaxID=278993 RepID=D5X9V5_THEPJ|nr:MULTISPECIES: ribosomal L7Ae/L30e/S12e/Gadd45 family protein [Thermincola]ADG81176.1 ribosomal protein L7Ae/L30e/S12e/Gadd45 [Thermincola potens JR]KNZ69486.1 ribosomal protein L7Ae/L30e/S12e/Gadd45 [Thermincola ferriacetica]